jgi:hypothetical protein
MPSWVDSMEEEKAWEKAKSIVQDQRKKHESKFSDRDWGLVTHIAQNILKSSVLSSSTSNGIIYRLAKVDRMLRARAAKHKLDASLSAPSRTLVGAVKRFIRLGELSISAARSDKLGISKEQADALVHEVMSVTAKLELLLGDRE